MKRILVLALGLLFAPAFVSAQSMDGGFEIGVDAGLSIEKITDVDDTGVSFDVPSMGIRLAFGATPSVLVETLLQLSYSKFGDQNATAVALVPGVNIMVGEQLYVRPEAGLLYQKFDSGSFDASSTQYLFGGAVGVRRPLGMGGAILRFEAGVDRLLENSDDGVPSSWDFRGLVGVSAVVGG